MTKLSSDEQRPLDLPALRRQLGEKKGKEFWRSLNELANSEEFTQLVRKEFPRQAGLLDTLNRRDFLKVLGASLALAGLAACTPAPAGKILPYSIPPEELIPGKPAYFASAMPMDGFAQGVLVKTDMGRPIKVDGNPRHPSTLGASDIFIQASILDLYDPDRARDITSQGQTRSWDDFVAAVGEALSGSDGAGLRILTETVTSPTLNDQLRILLETFPQARWLQYSGGARDASQAGMELAFGQPVEAVYHFDQAEVILSLDADFLFREAGSIRYGRDFGLRHQPVSELGVMNRLYVIESSQTLTGANADHRLAVKPSQVAEFARAVASRIGIDAGAPAADIPGANWLDPLVADLQRAGANALVVAGDRQPAGVHALAHAINQMLGAAGTTVTYTEPVTFNPVNQMDALRELAADLDGGGVDLLVMLGGNPAYSAPADLDFGARIARAGQSIYLGLYADETAALATWFVPAAHYLEMWSDARAYDGTLSIIQPVIEPLYGGKSPHELLAALLGQGTAAGYDLVRQFWQAQGGAAISETTWRQALRDGFLPDSAAPAASVTAQFDPAGLPSGVASAGGLEIVFEPDPTVWDGCFTNNAWLQELPKPLTKLTWDNAALLSPRTAEGLGVTENDLVELALRGRSVQAPVFVQPGLPDDTVVVTLGYGRTQGGRVQEGAGYNANLIRTSEAPWFDSGVEVRPTGETYNLVTTRDHQTMENRDLVRFATLDQYQETPNFAQLHETEQKSLYGEWEYNSYAWGMSINLNTCIGCNACVVACQSENNIPTVGKGEVERAREMHWLRIDRYFHGEMDSPGVFFQPVPCMHCEKAPCEPVCPVEATSHSAEGINEMTYNRCVGTRYCSNNCPYKVRRFNFFKYVDDQTLPLKAMRNPDVTVRNRGVMEKCTYCVQRVNQARIQAEVEGRRITDGEVKTACQQACPTNAIVFGDINDPNSAVRKLKETPLNYALLEELGTQPRTTYLAKVKNPNQSIPEQA